jgi:hypothetical protein
MYIITLAVDGQLRNGSTLVVGTQRMFRDMGQIRRRTPKAVLGEADAQVREELILDLANLQGTNCGPFWKRWDWLPRESDEELLSLRDELRRALSSDPTQNENLAHTLNKWVRWKPSGPITTVSSFVVNTQWRSIRLNPANLRLSLAFALMELYGKLAQCGNEQCPQPFFIRGKKKQRFCDRPNCKASGQREHKRIWWQKHGKQWLAGRERKIKKSVKEERGKLNDL